MSVECTSCGHLIPEGQSRCDNCGEPAPREASAQGAMPPAEEPTDAPVPKGTFASVAPQAPAALAVPQQEPRPGAAVREPSDPVATRTQGQSASQRVTQARPVVRPPFLASESLREDLSPLSPGKQTIVYTLQVAGGLGALACVAVGYDQLLGWACALLCVGLLVLSRLDLEYDKRASLAAVVSGTALAAVCTGRLALGAGSDDPLLVAACSLLPATLHFRSWYRAARVARAMVAGALVLAFAWIALTSHRGLLVLGFTWTSWLPALAWSLFCLLCLLSLLAFMGDETTGGCHVWAFGMSSWFGLFASLRWAIERTEGTAPNPSLAPLGLVEAALAAALSIALAQLGARLYVARSRLMPNAS